MIAASEGRSVADTIAALRHQQDFDVYVQDVRNKYPDSYAGSWTDQAPQRISVVRVKGEAPSDLVDAAAASNGRIRVVGGARHSWTELTELATAVSAALGLEEFGPSTTTISARDGRIEVTVPAKAPDGRANSVEAVRASIAHEASTGGADVASIAGDGLVVEIAPADAAYGGEHTYGGGAALDDGVRECTTGFTVDMSDGDTGVLTAAHCDGINQYRQEDGVTYGMPWVDEHVGVHGDLELHTSTHIEPDDFYSDVGTLRDVAGISPITEFDEGDYVCKFGRTTGYGCSTIYRLWVCYFPDSRQACNVVAMNAHITAGGDSGGPWFLVNTAWGVHSGVSTIDGTARSIFTPVFWVDNEFGAFIRQ